MHNKIPLDNARDNNRRMTIPVTLPLASAAVGAMIAPSAPSGWCPEN